MLLEPEAGHEFELRTWTRNNITETLNSLKVNTVDDIQQISAALAQCTVRPLSPPLSLQLQLLSPCCACLALSKHRGDRCHLLASSGFLC